MLYRCRPPSTPIVQVRNTFTIFFPSFWKKKRKIYLGFLVGYFNFSPMFHIYGLTSSSYSSNNRDDVTFPFFVEVAVSYPTMNRVTLLIYHFLPISILSTFLKEHPFAYSRYLITILLRFRNRTKKIKKNSSNDTSTDGMDLYIPPRVDPKPNLLTLENFVSGVELLGMSDAQFPRYMVPYEWCQGP